MNSTGTNISIKHSGYLMYIRLIFPGSASGIFARVESKKFEPFPAEKIDEVIHLYKAGENVVTPECGTMKVLFKPSGVSVLLTRILYSTNAKSVYEKTSPIMEKTGEKIFDPEFTLYDDPLDDNYPWAQSFDDEGTKCTPISIIENGILKNFYSDLHYAQKLGTNSTGHGYKSGYFAIGNKPVPTLQHIKINPGTTPFEKLVQSMDKGIILEGSIGGHSGNIPNGDFSVGIKL